ncbi:MAG: shikimate dehydrogenase, partial [Deltaproteobacteria bacterium]|nr:shikimate dehydrogenase [Deltaproteobacteria bacterium]
MAPSRSSLVAHRSSLSGRTRVVGIIGDPVSHSRSPAMHNAAFAALKLDWVYVPFPVAAADVGAALAAVRALGLAGINVTVPHKEAVLAHCDRLTPLARRVGAVNTLVNQNGRLLGDNTDVYGFAATLRAQRIRLRGRHAIVVGAGGAARAVLA